MRLAAWIFAIATAVAVGGIIASLFVSSSLPLALAAIGLLVATACMSVGKGWQATPEAIRARSIGKVEMIKRAAS